MIAVRTSSLGKHFGTTPVLHDLNLEIPAGGIFSLLGPNGSGKSTFFRILSTLVSPDSGRAEVAGHDVVAAPAAVRTRIGVVFQSPSLDKKLTVHENLRYGGALYGLHGRDLAARIAGVIGSLKLGEKQNAIVETLSGGQQRRAEIAKCLLTRPEILLLDEPSTGLDPAARMDLWAIISSLREESGMTVIFTTHLMDEAAKADTVGILNSGRLIACDQPARLLEGAGPEVLRVTTNQERAVAAYLSTTCHLRPHSVDGEVRAAAVDAHGVATGLTAAMPEAVISTTVAKPTLEDVFLFQTGSRLNE